MTQRLTTAQAVIQYLKRQHVCRDGREHPFFGGCFGIFGHCNVAGLGRALQQHLDLQYHFCRNEQVMVHTAVAFTKMDNSLRAFVGIRSIGPVATKITLAGARPQRILP